LGNFTYFLILTDSKQKQIALEKIRKDIAKCFLCPLSKQRKNTVPGEGSVDAEIMFIGEAPGANEDETGIPFCGQAGKFLDEMLASIDLKRESVFIANTCKCRPPDNRDPLPEEKETCRPYLEQQFDIIDPKIVVCLGKHSMLTFLPTCGGITKVHGKPFMKKNGRIYLPLYHPAAALHNGGLRQTLINDFQVIPKILKKLTKNNINKVSQKKLI
jgi:uracil-DNA glycosylase